MEDREISRKEKKKKSFFQFPFSSSKSILHSSAITSGVTVAQLWRNWGALSKDQDSCPHPSRPFSLQFADCGCNPKKVGVKNLSNFIHQPPPVAQLWRNCGATRAFAKDWGGFCHIHPGQFLFNLQTLKNFVQEAAPATASILHSSITSGATVAQLECLWQGWLFP